MENIVLSTVLAFMITYAAIPVIIRVAEIKKLFDLPDSRKIHIRPVPSLGGLGIFAGFVMACLMTVSFAAYPEFQYIIAAGMVIFFLGLKDDILVLTAMKKIIGQLVAAFILIYKGDVIIRSMHGFLGVQELPTIFSLALTYFTIIVIINSFNLIDGVDGLAGSLGLLTSMLLGSYFYLTNDFAYATLAFALSGSLIAFLIFNYSPAKIFMGDTGSLLIGMVNAILVIRFINVANRPGIPLPVIAAPAIGFAILIVPLFDTLRVFATRILKRNSPFSPDRTHVHHLLLDRGMSHTSTTFTLVGANIVLFVGAILCQSLGNTWLIALLVGISSVSIGILFYTRPRPKLYVEPKPLVEEDIPVPSKLIPINTPAAIAENN